MTVSSCRATEETSTQLDIAIASLEAEVIQALMYGIPVSLNVRSLNSGLLMGSKRL